MSLFLKSYNDLYPSEPVSKSPEEWSISFNVFLYAITSEEALRRVFEERHVLPTGKTQS